ncbi:MAG: exopolyphosphatase [Actinomycetota bacterium]
MTRVAVVDVGTNSVRLLIADVSNAGLREIARELVITRLGEGVDAARAFAADALARTVGAIARYVRDARAQGATQIRVIATSAVRDAGDRERFVEDVIKATGVSPEVLSGDQEALLGFAGASSSLDVQDPYLICDIGGGSTELVFGRARAERWISLDVGSVRATERCIRNDPPSPAEVAEVRKLARAHLDRASQIPRGFATFVGLAGTITTMAAVARGLMRYDRARIHGSRLTRAEVAGVTTQLARMTSDERRTLPVMPLGREDVIVSGAVILEEAMDRFDAHDVVVSESDILDGAALEIARAARS